MIEQCISTEQLSYLYKPYLVGITIENLVNAEDVLDAGSNLTH